MKKNVVLAITELVFSVQSFAILLKLKSLKAITAYVIQLILSAIYVCIQDIYNALCYFIH